MSSLPLADIGTAAAATTAAATNKQAQDFFGVNPAQVATATKYGVPLSQVSSIDDGTGHVPGTNTPTSMLVDPSTGKISITGQAAQNLASGNLLAGMSFGA